MDQKKTLWICIAAGLFLAVVIGAAVILSAPAAKKEASVTALKTDDVWISPSAPVLPSENIGHGKTSKPESLPPKPEAPGSDFLPPAPPKTNSPEAHGNVTQTENLTVIANGTTSVYGVTTIDLNMLKSPQNTAPAQEPKPAESEAKKENAPAAVKAVETPKKQEPVQTKKEESKTTSKKTETKPAETKTSSKKTESKPAAKKTEPKAEKLPDQFWVQAASYSTKKNADEARELLDENGIPCEVFTFKDANGNLYYRVRVGPYTTKSEAEYWKGRIESIKLFASTGAYVTNTSAAKK